VENFLFSKRHSSAQKSYKRVSSGAVAALSVLKQSGWTKVRTTPSSYPWKNMDQQRMKVEKISLKTVHQAPSAGRRRGEKKCLGGRNS